MCPEDSIKLGKRTIIDSCFYGRTKTSLCMTGSEIIQRQLSLSRCHNGIILNLTTSASNSSRFGSQPLGHMPPRVAASNAACPDYQFCRCFSGHTMFPQRRMENIHIRGDNLNSIYGEKVMVRIDAGVAPVAPFWRKPREPEVIDWGVTALISRLESSNLLYSTPQPSLEPPHHRK
jgi:hypothetical protein